MKRYLSQIPLQQAISLLVSTFPRPQRSETIPVDLATGRIVASAVYAPETVPKVRIATMDGIAAKSADTASAQDQNPCILTDASPISTGEEVPAPYDAVIPSEEVWFGAPEQYKIRKPSRKFQNIRQPGDEVKNGRLILEPGHRITPSDIGALLTYGVRSIQV
ncbi:MAG: molybdopterin biosynthesis protein, partial [Methanobacteriota archaeon]